MPMTRRDFVASTAASMLAGSLVAATTTTTPPLRAQTAAKVLIKAVAFDALAIFDPRPVSALAEQCFPGKGAGLIAEWRIRQFEYTWLRVITGRYADFWRVTQDALLFAARKLSLDLSPRQRDELMNAWLELKAWPDAPDALAALKKSGTQLALLSNFTPAMLEDCIRSAGLTGTFDHVLSTDQVKTYKPTPPAYQLGIDALRFARGQILFVAFAGWDAVGAKSFGYPTFWVNRLKLPAEELGEPADGMGSDLSTLAEFLAAH